ncbi:MAG: S9 family peptidase [Truepera sp.]|nr:S9 family peptidase [Truepera sp.]
MRKGRVPLEELARLPKFAFLTPAYRRDRVAFYWDKTGRFELYTLDLTTRELKQHTDGQAPKGLRAGFSWTRDDKAIIFAKDKDGDEQNNLFWLELASGEIRQLNDDPKTQEYVGEVHPDNRRLAVMSNRAGQMNLFALELKALAWQQLTDFKAPAFAGRWSTDGEWLAVVSNESDNLTNQDAYLVRHDGSETKKVFSVEEGSQDRLADWHPDGRRAAVTSDAGGSNRPGILDLQTGEVRWLGFEGIEERAVEFSRDGAWLLTIRNVEATLLPVLYEVESGEARSLNLPPGLSGTAWFVLDDSKFVLDHSATNRRLELLLYDLASDTTEVILPAEYGSLGPELFVTEEYVRYPSFDGQQVPALLYKPAEIEPGEKLPALVMVHGGPTWQFFRSFDPYAQFLVDRGHVVLQPNIRGSTGYGVAWRDANLKDWGGGDLEDVAAGAEFLKTLPYVDPERIGIFGGSFGGFITFLAVVKKPELFKIGVPWIGITDLHQLYEEDMEHFKYYFRQQMGDPEQDYQLWRDRSAIEFADRLKAKLLVIHGVNDPRCPVTQSRLFRDKLLALGKREGKAPEDDFEYHEFEDEGHGPSGDIQGTIRTYQLLADFLERRL